MIYTNPIRSSSIFACNADVVKTLPSFIEQMDREEKKEKIPNDREKRSREEALSGKQIVAISSMIAGGGCLGGGLVAFATAGLLAPVAVGTILGSALFSVVGIGVMARNQY